MPPDEVQGTETEKFCMVCHQTFTGRMQACPQDGTVLIPTTTGGGKRDPFLGTILADKYEILEICGKGGMGLVYKAKQQLIDRIVAIKMLKADLLGDEQSVKRFQLEAKAASRLQHPNVITVHDFGVVDATGQPYLVMDFMEGESLAELIKAQGRLNVRRALPIFTQACSALEHAHRQHVIHRDVKPSNIVLIKSEERDDFVKVVDFGIAKLTAVAGQESLHLTKTGEVFGSPIYMSPEQCMGNPLNARSDIYSLGATMYESLVGFPPLVGKTLVDTMSKHINETPPMIRATWPELCVPEGIERIILKALEKDKELRYESMLEMKEALDFEYKRLTAGEDGDPQSSGSQGEAPGRISVANIRTDFQKEVPSGKAHMDSLRSATSKPASPVVPIAIAVLVVALLAGVGWFIWSHMTSTSANGILFYLKEGKAGGVAHVMTVPGRNRLNLSFQSLPKEKLKGGLGGAYGGENGANWTVNFHKGDNGLVLDDVKFNSSYDEPVQSADQLIRRHYVDLSEKRYEQAYQDLSEEWRHKESYEHFRKGNEAVGYWPDAKNAPVEAIKIEEQGPEIVKLMTDLKWFTGKNEEFVRFVIRKLYGKWQIDKVERIQKDEWDAV